MQSIARAAMGSGNTGEPLPDIYPVLAQSKHKARFRRGGTSMIAGPPGSFKSTLALNLTCRWAEKGMCGLYISADSDEMTFCSRAAAILSGDPKEKIDKVIKRGDYTSTLRRLADVRAVFKALDINGMDLQMQAFDHVYGQMPDFVVVDNLMNCVAGPSDFAGQITMTRDLDTLARYTRSHIVILHHTSESYHDSEPPARWDIQGKVNQFPRLILTVNATGPLMKVAVVKNTNGPQQPDGKDYEDFLIDTSNYRIVEAVGNELL